MLSVQLRRERRCIYPLWSVLRRHSCDQVKQCGIRKGPKFRQLNQRASRQGSELTMIGLTMLLGSIECARVAKGQSDGDDKRNPWDGRRLGVFLVISWIINKRDSWALDKHSASPSLCAWPCRGAVVHDDTHLSMHGSCIESGSESPATACRQTSCAMQEGAM